MFAMVPTCLHTVAPSLSLKIHYIFAIYMQYILEEIGGSCFELTGSLLLEILKVVLLF
jgi:hypothetical protein